VTEFEMQARHETRGTPVAAIERVAAEQVECGRDRFAVLLGDDHQAVLRQTLAERVKEIKRQVGPRMVLAIGVLVTAEEEVPVLRRDVAAAQGATFYAGGHDLLALLTDFL